MIEYCSLTPADIGAVCRLQETCYQPAVHESAHSLQAKIIAAAHSCFLASKHGVAVGYVIALPWKIGLPIALDSPSCQLPVSADCMYIHDVAVCASVRGDGVGKQLLALVQAETERCLLSRQCLVAVQGAEAFWQGLGFQRLLADARMDAFLAPYGEDTAYMERAVPLPGRDTRFVVL